MIRKILNFDEDNFNDLEFEAARKEIQAFAYPEIAEISCPGSLLKCLEPT